MPVWVREFFKTTIIGGLLVVFPVGIVVVLIARVILSIHDALAPAMAHLPYGSLFPGLMAMAIVLGVCFLTGLVVQTRIGKRISLALERGVLGRMPGYMLLKNLSQRAVGESDGVALAAALLETGDGLVPGFIVEEHEDGRYTVFIPDVPTPAMGTILIMSRELVHPIDVPFRKVVQCIGKWGMGMGELLKAMRENPSAPGLSVAEGNERDRLGS